MKFTGKYAFLGVFGGLRLTWSPLSTTLADLLPITIPIQIVFVTGIIGGLIGPALLGVVCVIATFQRFHMSLHSVG